MQDLIVITPLHVDGELMCRIPACCDHAKVHVDSYIRCSSEEAWWDPQNSGPLCLTHLTKLKAQDKSCEFRQLELRELSLGSFNGPVLTCSD